jgi:cell division septal protein FtsQ
VGVYYYFAGSKFFALRDVDVQGNVLLSSDEIKETVEAAVTRGVLRADLEQIQSKLKTNEVIKEAEVTRLLPDMLRVSIVEREPYALARRSDGSVACVDRDGLLFGNQSLFKSKQMMPLISGLAETGDNLVEINRQRMLTYQKLMADLDGSQPPLSSRIDEVVFDDVQGVRVILADSRIAVFLGKEDFRMRLNAALDVLDAIRRNDAEALNVLRIGDAEKLLSGAKISYLNATTPKRVVVGLDE